MTKESTTESDENKKFIKKDDDLGKKGTLDHEVEPPWVLKPKQKSGANDRGHRNRP